MPLDEAMRDSVKHMSQPYPKRPKQATSGDHPDGGGAAPTRTLHTKPQVRQ
jgi:hypothetical protein